MKRFSFDDKLLLIDSCWYLFLLGLLWNLEGGNEAYNHLKLANFSNSRKISLPLNMITKIVLFIA
jgi:hypothetical protein